ncbi:hypothetical protein [Halovivax limisalsi]|uniref:hypothetical protein n=1 Tax=Halovivax limisalsi TaxID=1453760 RepID=UPI001FFDD545|nr:hypothetical protein [Halovivax limisalsi]
MRMDTHNAASRTILVLLPIVVLLAMVGIGLWAASGAAVVDPGNGTVVTNETVTVDNTTTTVYADLSGTDALQNETNVTAWLYNSTDVANASVVGNDTVTLNATVNESSLQINVTNATENLTNETDWALSIVGTGDTGEVSVLSFGAINEGGGGGGAPISGGEAGGIAAGVLALLVVGVGLARRGA